MPHSPIIRALSSVTLAWTLAASPHHGQVQYGGLPAPGVTVTATQADKKFVALTDMQGTYSFPDLPDGTWSFQIEMLCFSTIHQDITIAPTAPSPVWELKLLPLTEIHAQIRPAAPPAPPTPNAQAPPPPQPGYQRTDLNASSAKDSIPTPTGAVSEAEPTTDDLAQRAADGFLINGTANNGASSPFGLAAAFGNNRTGPKSLYNGN